MAAIRLQLRCPTGAELLALAESVRPDPLTYEPVGSTLGEMPDGWAHDSHEGVIGHGEEAWERAVAALEDWQMFQLSWVRLARTGPPVEGTSVAFASWQLGVWSVQACRVVRTVRRDDALVRQHGFAYGTLRPHAVRGEELFLVTWDRPTDEVRFLVRKFSRPSHPLIAAMQPLSRRVQRAFNVDAIAAMRSAVRGELVA